jgi:hypothetical protein
MDLWDIFSIQIITSFSEAKNSLFNKWPWGKMDTHKKE